MSFANCLNFDSLVLLASRIINPEEYPSFIKLCGMNIIHSLSSFSSISLIASFAEFFSTVPDNCFDIISEYIPQLVDQILSPTTLAKISFSTLSKTDFDIVFYIFHFIARLDHIKYLQNHQMQVYLFFSCEMIESINKQSDIDSFSRVLPLIDEYLTYEQTNSIIQLIEKRLNCFQFLNFF